MNWHRFLNSDEFLIEEIVNWCYLYFFFSWNVMVKYGSWVQRASWFDASRNFGTRSSISQCFSRKYDWHIISLIVRFSGNVRSVWYSWLPVWTDSGCFPCSCCCEQDPHSKIERFADNKNSSFGARLQLLGLQTCNSEVVVKVVRVAALCLSFYLCYCLCQISESLKRCGISDSTSYVLAARFGASADEVRLWSPLLELFISLKKGCRKNDSIVLTDSSH